MNDLVAVTLTADQWNDVVALVREFNQAAEDGDGMNPRNWVRNTGWSLTDIPDAITAQLPEGQ